MFVIPGLYTASSGMVAHQAKLDVLANNLANADTVGFKADVPAVDVSGSPPFDLSGQESPAASPGAGRLGLDLSPGILKQTGNPFDLAILGTGLFVVQTPQGERYTRAGSFTRDANGFLVTPEGFQLLSDGGPVRVPEGGLRVGSRGEIAGAGRLRIVAGPDHPGLTKAGGNLYALIPGAAPPPAAPETTVVQGQLESSNVNVVRTMVEMLATLRSYEAYQRTIQALDQTANQAAGELGRA
jgi:flagellar basal-body rod protein FlgG